MAITKADFEKIWASTSPLTPYPFSDSQYKEGWNFIGSTPPARQMWDFLQKNNDEKMQYLANNYLPLSGGTMTGKLQSDVGAMAVPIELLTTGTDYRDIQTFSTDGNHRIGLIRMGKDSSNNCKVTIGASNTSNDVPSGITITRGPSGDSVITGITPPAGDNSTKIATTEFVNATAKAAAGYYNSVAEMRKSETAIVGRPCVTLGYYEPNDGGGAVYIIRSKKESDVDDGGSIIFLDNGNVSELIIDGVINVKQFGAKGDGETDDSNAFTSLLSYAEAQTKMNVGVDYLPSGTFEGINIYIPRGMYILTKTLNFPSLCSVEGDGTYNTILKFKDTDYGISLKGLTGNGGRGYKHAKIKGFMVNMNDGKVGISNIPWSESAQLSNNVDSCRFEDLEVVNADVGYAFAGMWNTTFDKISARVCQIGGFSVSNIYSGGNNNNTYLNIMITSCTDCGWYTADYGALFKNFDAEGIGTSWNANKKFKGSLALDKIRLTIERPCGMYIYGKASVRVESPWFEAINDVEVDDATIESATIYINHYSDEITAVNSEVVIESMFKNNNTNWGVWLDDEVDNFVLRDITTKGNNHVCRMCYPTKGLYKFENMSLFNAQGVKYTDGVTNKDPHNNIIFRDIRDVGSYGCYDRYINGNVSQYSIGMLKYVYPNDDKYSFTAEKRIDTARTRIVTTVNGKDSIGINYTNGWISCYQNSGEVTVASGSKTVDIPFKKWTQGGVNVLFTAQDEAGVTLLSGGYYVVGSDGSKASVKFINTATANLKLTYFCI